MTSTVLPSRPSALLSEKRKKERAAFRPDPDGSRADRHHNHEQIDVEGASSSMG